MSLVNQPKKVHGLGFSFEMPTILVKNGWKWQVMLIEALVTGDRKPHPHRLEEPNCQQGVYVHQAGEGDPHQYTRYTIVTPRQS